MPPSFVRIIPHRRVVGSWRCAVGNKTSQIHPFSIHNTFKTAHIPALPLLDFPHQLFAQHTASRRSGSDIIGKIAFHVLKEEQAALFSVEKDMLFEQTDNLLLMVDKKAVPDRNAAPPAPYTSVSRQAGLPAFPKTAPAATVAAPPHPPPESSFPFQQERKKQFGLPKSPKQPQQKSSPLFPE